jgi:ABC-type polysaccharide/polyol phosphate export permease
MTTATERLPHPAVRGLTYWLFRYRRTWRGSIVISVVNPLFFMIALGLGLGKLIDARPNPELHGATYAEFIVPGLLIAAVMQTAFLEAAGPVFQSTRPTGNYRSAAAAPLRPADIFHGHLLYWLLRAAQNSILFVAVCACFGAVSIVHAALLVPVAVLVAVSFSAPASAWAVTVDRPARLNMMFRFVILPLYMFSGTFFPIEQLPSWLQPVAWATPLWHGIDLARGVALGTATLPRTIVHVAYLAALTAAGMALARRNYRRQLYV